MIIFFYVSAIGHRCLHEQHWLIIDELIGAAKFFAALHQQFLTWKIAKKKSLFQQESPSATEGLLYFG
jgi:hypothetical protein